MESKNAKIKDVTFENPKIEFIINRNLSCKSNALAAMRYILVALKLRAIESLYINASLNYHEIKT